MFPEFPPQQWLNPPPHPVPVLSAAVLPFSCISKEGLLFICRSGFWESCDLEYGSCPERGRRKEWKYSQDALSDGQSLRYVDALTYLFWLFLICQSSSSVCDYKNRVLFSGKESFNAAEGSRVLAGCVFSYLIENVVKIWHRGIQIPLEVRELLWLCAWHDG